MRGGLGEDERQGEEGHEGEGPEVAEEELERESVVVGHQHAHGRGVDAVPVGGRLMAVVTGSQSVSFLVLLLPTCGVIRGHPPSSPRT